MKIPTSIKAKPVLIFRGVKLKRKPVPIIMSIIPMIFALTRGWLGKEYCLNLLNPPIFEKGII
jgi:hypothetical protein